MIVIGSIATLAIFLFVGWAVSTEMFQQRAWRKRVESGDVAIVGALIEEALGTWRSARPPRGTPASLWAGVQGVQLVAVTQDSATLSTSAEAEFRSEDGQRVRTATALDSAIALASKVIDMMLYAPKYQFYQGQRTSAAVGVMHFVIVGENVRLGLAYTVVTTGGDDDALTVGAGWAYARYHEDEYSPCFPTTAAAAAACPGPQRVTKTPGSPVAMVGGEHRVSRRVKILTENYAFKRGAILSAGVRFLGERLSADLGVFAPVTGEDTFVLAPIVNVAWTFGR